MKGRRKLKRKIVFEFLRSDGENEVTVNTLETTSSELKSVSLLLCTNTIATVVLRAQVRAGIGDKGED